MKKSLLSLLALALALVLPGCLEYETEITLNKDGSGTITEEMVMGAQMIGMMEMTAAQGGQQSNPLTEMKDKEKLNEKAKSYGEGVTFSKTEDISRNDGGKGVRVTYNFTDINKVTFSPSSGMNQLGSLKPGSKIEEQAKDAQATFAYAEGKLTINLPQPDETADADGEKKEGGRKFDPNDPQMAMMAEMMRGMKMSGKVTLADGIAETNATHHAENTITLFEIDFDEMMKDPAALQALGSIDRNNPASAAKALKKVKGAKAESQKEVTATVK